MILSKKDISSVSAAASVLRAGNAAVLPTDTIYGFSALDSEKGAELIRKIKGGRPTEKSFIRLIFSPEDLKKYTSVKIKKELLDLWPGAVTLILPLDSGGTAAFRCPADAWLRSVVSQTGSAIFSTSVNISGEKPLLRAADIEKKFGNYVDLIIEDDPPENSGQTVLPSTIVDASSVPFRIVRQGAVLIPKEMLNS